MASKSNISAVEPVMNMAGPGTSFAQSIGSFKANAISPNTNFKQAVGSAVAKVDAARNMAADVNEVKTGLAREAGLDAGPHAQPQGGFFSAVIADTAKTAILGATMGPLAATAYTAATIASIVGQGTYGYKGKSEFSAGNSQEDGYQMSADASPEPVSYTPETSFADEAMPIGPAVQPQIQLASAKVVAEMGADSIRAELLGGPTNFEKQIGELHQQGLDELATIEDILKKGPQNLPQPVPA